MKSTSLRIPALCLSLMALAACGSGKDQSQQKMPTPKVGVIKAEPQTVPLTKNLVGRLSPFRSADVRARVSGLLLKRTYTEGTDVKQGQLLFEVDPATYQAALNVALANLASAQATAANAHVTANRDRALIGKGYISQAQLDTDEATERTSAAAVKQAQASVDSARIDLSYTKVTSPIDGRAGQQQLTEGAMVGNSTTDTGASSTLLTTVEQLDPLYVNFTLSATDMQLLRGAETAGHVKLSDQAKTTIQITLSDGTKYDRSGTLDFSDASVNPSTGAINLRAILPNPQRALLPGTYVTFAADLGEQNGVYLVPQAAVQRDVAGAYVLVVGQDNKVVRKDVDTSNTSGSNWIVNSGISAGDQIIVSGLQSVQPGGQAEAQPWQPDAQGNNAPGAAASSGQPAGKQ